MNDNNNNFQMNLSNAAISKCRILRMKNGFKSLRKNPIKAVIALLYVMGGVVLWLHRKQFILCVYSGNSTLLSQMWYMIFTWGIPILATLLFLVMMALFGTVIHYANKFLSACISAGICTSVGKSPWLLNRYKDKKEPIYKVWEIFLNGNADDDFKTKQKKLESELGVKIHRFEMKGTRILLMYTTPENAKLRDSTLEDTSF